MKLQKEDYLDPACVLCGKPGEPETGTPVPMGRVMDRLREYEAQSDYAAMERHLLYWLAEAEANGDRRAQLTLHNELMGHYRKEGKGEQAIHHAEAAVHLIDLLDLRETVTAGTTWINAGTVLEAFGNPEAALPYFDRARENYEKNLPDNDGRLGGLYNNMALALTALGHFGEAEAYFRTALRVMEKQEYGELEQAITWLNLADTAEAERGAEAAEPLTEEYLERAERLLNADHLPRNGYYAFVCEKCAPVFGHYGWFAAEAELRERARQIDASMPKNRENENPS